MVYRFSIQKLWITELVLTQKEIWRHNVFLFSPFITLNNFVEMQSHCCWRPCCTCLPAGWIFELLFITLHANRTWAWQCTSAILEQRWEGSGAGWIYIICQRSTSAGTIGVCFNKDQSNPLLSSPCCCCCWMSAELKQKDLPTPL